MSKNALNDGTKHIGIIAQEVQSGSLGKWAISTGPDGYLRYDPNAVLYSLVNSIKELDKKKANSGSTLLFESLSGTLSSDISQVNSNIENISAQINALSGALALSNAQIQEIQQSVIAIGTSSGNTNNIAPVTPEMTLSNEDNLALNMILGTAENLIIQGKTLFQEMVTFTQVVIFEKAVIFKSLVTFEDRVIFGDRDMGGNIRINAGQIVAHVSFDRPYTETPVVTISPVDHYVVGKVTHLSRSGFDVEISSPDSV